MILTDPDAIERRSMEIIEEHLDRAGLLPAKENMAIVKRVIHATADFDYAKNLTFSPGAAAEALTALQNGCTIVTDTQMACAGIHKAAVEKLGCGLSCFMSDADVARTAKARGCTRASAAMEKAAGLPGPLIFAIGNAPTALLTLCDLIAAGKIKPALVIGVPVGFVNILEAKEALLNTNVPSIVAKGQKGGSNVAAAIVNALLYQLTR